MIVNLGGISNCGLKGSQIFVECNKTIRESAGGQTFDKTVNEIGNQSLNSALTPIRSLGA